MQKINLSENRPLILVFAAFALIALIIQSLGSLCPDVSWINYGTAQLLSGKTLYRDIVEVNPPIIYFISMPPLFLANALGFADSKMFFLVWIVLLCFGSTILLWAILSPLRQTSPRENNALLLGHMACGLILVGESFGQREQLVYLALMPYLGLCMMRSKGASVHQGLKILSGVIAGLGLALKPHYLVLIFVVEVWMLISNWPPRINKILRVEIVFAAATAIALAAVTLVFYPQFLGDVVPMTRLAYLPYDRESVSAILRLFEIMIAGIGIAIFAEWYGGATPHRCVLLAGALGAALAMLLQFRGFPYHTYPCVAILALWAGQQFANSKFKAPRLTAAASSLMLIGFMMINSIFAFKPFVPGGEPDWTAAYKGQSIAIFSTAIHNGFPLVLNHNLKWAFRFQSLWFMPFISDVERNKRMGNPVTDEAINMAEKLRHQAVDDLIENQPKLILIDEVGHALYGARPDFLFMLSKDSRFGLFFSGYKKLWERAGFSAYEKK